MSTNLYWLPVKPVKAHALPTGLKFALRKRCDGRVGDLVMDTNDLQYLYGLRDAGVEGAEELIAAIQKHVTVKVYEE